MWRLKGYRCVINDLCVVISVIIITSWPSPRTPMSLLCTVEESNSEQEMLACLPLKKTCASLVFFFSLFFLIKSLTCASVCGYRFVPNVSCAGSGFICVRRYWKRIPWAIWIQLIQLNTVNNWSDSETEPCHMGTVTSPLAGRNPTPVQLDCPGLFVPQSAHCIWLPPVKDTKQEHEWRMGGYSGIVVLSQSAQWQQSHWSPRLWKLMRLSHAQRGLQICTQSDLISRFSKKRKGWFLPPLVSLSHSPCLALINRLCGIACYKGPFPSQDLHVNQMDSAWVDYLPGHEITCK